MRKNDDLIRREDVLKAIREWKKKESDGTAEHWWNSALRQIAADIKAMPAVEEGERITCGNCKYLYDAVIGSDEFKWCDRVNGAPLKVTDDGSCSWGEAKESE